jgi:glucose dehydrogenase
MRGDFALTLVLVDVDHAMGRRNRLIEIGGKTADAGRHSIRSQTSSDKPIKRDGRDWPVYGGTPQNNHFSPLTQINRSNVQRLTVAWSV